MERSITDTNYLCMLRFTNVGHSLTAKPHEQPQLPHEKQTNEKQACKQGKTNDLKNLLIGLFRTTLSNNNEKTYSYYMGLNFNIPLDCWTQLSLKYFASALANFTHLDPLTLARRYRLFPFLQRSHLTVFKTILLSKFSQE